jgi:hypothetical protein
MMMKRKKTFLFNIKLNKTNKIYFQYYTEYTMNLSEDLSVDKELFSGVYEGKYNHI